MGRREIGRHKHHLCRPEAERFSSALAQELRAAELTLSLTWLEQIQRALDSPPRLSHGELREMVHALRHRILDEYAAPPPRLVAISAEKSRLLPLPYPFGYDVANTFQSANEDISEAVRCYALERNTACVFHLMRAIETALNALRNHLGVQLPANPVWGVVINTIEVAVKKARDEKRLGDDAVSNYTEVLSDLRIIKNAWRNPTMHLARSYDAELTLDILRATRRFLQDLAETLKTPLQ